MEASKTYFRTGLGLKRAVLPVLEGEYHSRIVDWLREHGYRASAGGLTIRLAEEFGYCYGVDRAVQYAYEARHKFPDRKLFLLGEIIHNPHVNERMREMGIEFLMPGEGGRFDFSGVTSADVVIIPAFGVTLHDFEELRQIGCLLVDTTCGSVLNVWKRVESYARDGYTAIIHGKFFHEESKATASQASRYGGAYLIVKDLDEARAVGAYIAHGRDRDDFLARFGHACSEGFDPDRDLVKVGVANQTTMLASETVKIAEEFRRAMIERYGAESLGAHYRHFDTLCSATQDRQDAVLKLMQSPPDIMIVIGGYNSSNTNHLAQMCAQHTRTYHLEDATCIDPESRTISHKVVGTDRVVSDEDWLPVGDLVEVGITAGASTPNNKIGDTIDRILATRGIEPAALLGKKSGPA